MHQTLVIITSLAGLVGAAGALGCSSPTTGDPSSSTCNSNPSFSTDVIPAFAMSCTLTNACHGQVGNSPEESLYLGMTMGGGGTADVHAVYNGLVGVVSKEDPSMPLVTKGDLQNSFLWHKVNDDQITLNSGTLATGCKKASAMCQDCMSMNPCGGTMPYNGYMLANPNGNPHALCTIQSWIMQGAQNN
jgi:hypothetical protein